MGFFALVLFSNGRAAPLVSCSQGTYLISPVFPYYAGTRQKFFCHTPGRDALTDWRLFEQPPRILPHKRLHPPSFMDADKPVPQNSFRPTNPQPTQRAGHQPEAFADRCGVMRTYMSRVETSPANPSLEAAKVIADGLELTLSDLLSGL